MSFSKAWFYFIYVPPWFHLQDSLLTFTARDAAITAAICQHLALGLACHKPAVKTVCMLYVHNKALLLLMKSAFQDPLFQKRHYSSENNGTHVET